MNINKLKFFVEVPKFIYSNIIGHIESLFRLSKINRLARMNHAIFISNKIILLKMINILFI